MSNIQQSINQTLYQAQIGAGLYAHSPAGKEAAEIHKKETNITKLNKKIEEGQSSTTDLTQRSEIAQELFNLDPTQERSDIAEEYSGTAQKRIQELRSSKERFELRQKLLEGTSEVPMKKTKIMEV